jgi:transposase
MDVSVSALLAIVELTKSVLSDAQYAILKAAILTLGEVAALLQSSKASIQRMRRLFAKASESTRKVLGKGKNKGKEKKDDDQQEKSREPEKGKADVEAGTTGEGQLPKEGQRWSNGGKYAVEEYTGAPHVRVPNPLLHQEGPTVCPCCLKEAKFRQSRLLMHLHLTGGAPVQGTVYELEQARCSICDKIITAQPPAGTEEKISNSAIVSVISHHYEAGLPFYTMEQLQDGFGIPLPAGTQWGMVGKAVPVFQAVHAVLESQAADGSLFYLDDTVMKILRYSQADRDKSLEPFGVEPGERTGMFATGIVSVCGEYLIVLYYTGGRHGGENLAWLLLQRDETLPTPLLMSDGATRNPPYMPGPPEVQKLMEVIELQCNAHARRNFVDVYDDFQKPVERVLLALKKVYATDAKAKELKLSPAQRLKLHQEESGPVMKELKEWMDERVTRKLVEPNSGLGSAISYMTSRWEKLTAFLRIEGAPLDNNTVERALKKVIRLRKRTMFYMNEEGADVGDLCLSMIESCRHNGVKPSEYMLALLDNEAAVLKRPWEWLPWSFKRALERLRAAGPEPAAPAVAAAAA